MSFEKDCHHTPKKCKGCIYRETSGVSICAYSIITGKLRGCSVEECTNFVPKYTGSHKKAYEAMKRKKANQCLTLH